MEASGELFDELHVDGGTSSQVFRYPTALDLRTTAAALGITGSRSIYVIRNGFLGAQWSPVKPKLMEIAKAAIAPLIRTHGLDDLYCIYIGAQRHGLDYNLAYIPGEFGEESTEGFDPVCVRALFGLGHEMAQEGYPWAKSPPGFVAD